METTERVIEGNKLIADFMGEKYTQINTEGKVTYHLSGVGQFLEELSYHQSFDSLMAVIDKIESMWIHVAIEKNSALITWMGAEDDEFPWLANFKDIHIENAGTKINATWLSVIEFIRFYNKNK